MSNGALDVASRFSPPGITQTTLPQLHTLVISGGECPHSAAAQRSGLIRTHILDAVHVVMCHCYFLPLGVEVRGFQYPGSLGEEAPPTQGPSTAVSRVQVHPDAVSEALAALLGALLAGGIRGASGGRASFPAEYVRWLRGVAVLCCLLVMPCRALIVRCGCDCVGGCGLSLWAATNASYPALVMAVTLPNATCCTTFDSCSWSGHCVR